MTSSGTPVFYWAETRLLTIPEEGWSINATGVIKNVPSKLEISWPALEIEIRAALRLRILTA